MSLEKHLDEVTRANISWVIPLCQTLSKSGKCLGCRLSSSLYYSWGNQRSACRMFSQSHRES